MQILAHMLIWFCLYEVTNESHLSMEISGTYSMAKQKFLLPHLKITGVNRGKIVPK